MTTVTSSALSLKKIAGQPSCGSTRAWWLRFFTTLGSSNVPAFRIITPGLAPGSSAIDEPHSGQKCLRIGLPLPPMLLKVLSVPSISTASE